MEGGLEHFEKEDAAPAFYIDAHEMFLKELRANGFSDLERLGTAPTIELDASTGEKAVKQGSNLVKALTEGEGALTIDEVASVILVEGKEDLYKNSGFYVYRMARPGAIDTIPIKAYNDIVAGKGTKNVKPMALEEARATLGKVEDEFGVTEEKWEQIGASLLAAGVKSFIEAEQDLRIGMLGIVVDEAIKQGNYDYALTQIQRVNMPGVTSEKQLGQIDALRGKVESARVARSSADTSI